MSSFPRYKGTVWATAIIAASITFTVYLPALQNGFVNWDDDTYVYNNHNIQSIDLRFLKRIFTAEANPTWHPLTLFSHALDYTIWKLDPWGHHLTNIIFHTVNTFLVFILAGRLAGRQTCWIDKKALIVAIVTALLFGIHPLHVESAAWISERKDVLCAFFFLLSLLAYLKYTSSMHSKRYIFYGICLIFFILALLSKPMAVSLPIVLLILDFYPLERLTIKGGLKIIIRLMREKFPFFVLTILSSYMTIWIHYQRGALLTIERYSLITRICVAIRAYIFYLFKMVFFVNLAPYYPSPAKIDPFTFEYIGSFILLLAITFFCVRSLKRKKIFLVVWLYYIVTLIPVIGIIRVGEFAAADRYTYLPSLGPFLLVGVLAGYIFEKYSKKHPAAIIFTILIVLTIMINQTVKQIGLWKDSITIWTHEINLFPDTAYMAYNNRGNAYDILGSHKHAMADFNRAIEINPDSVVAYNNRGNAYNGLGKYQKAISDFNMAIEINPKYTRGYNNRGIVHINLGSNQKAIVDFTTAIKLNPEYADAYNNRGVAYGSLGKFQQAMADFNRAIELNPKHANAYNNIGEIYSLSGDTEQAQKFYREAKGLGLR